MKYELNRVLFGFVCFVTFLNYTPLPLPALPPVPPFPFLSPYPSAISILPLSLLFFLSFPFLLFFSISSPHPILFCKI